VSFIINPEFYNIFGHVIFSFSHFLKKATAKHHLHCALQGVK
jgi:hypothetical protein